MPSRNIRIAELTDASVVQTTLIHISKTELRVDLRFQT